MDQPTLDPSTSTPIIGDKKPDISKELEIVSALESYRIESDNNRKSGMNPRDSKWRENLNLYHNRFDFSRKANWQAREVMPEVPQYVDRFAAALKEALVSNQDGFYNIKDPADQDKDLAPAIQRMTNVWLSQTGRNQLGTPLSFPAVFEEQMKLGAIMACSAVVTWKKDTPAGRVAIETIDPRMVWLDHTGRNLYRMRRTELDKHDLYNLASAKDGKGKSLFNLPEVQNLVGSMTYNSDQEKMELTGHGQQVASGRQPVYLDEYIATVLNSQGEMIADRSLMVVANNKFLIRGPEANPFWHGNDWLVYAPLVTVPLSVYGRSYMEDFGAIAHTFNELTNMILDAVFASSLKSYAIVPGMLLNPDQIAEGLKPNKLWLLEEGMASKDFASALDLGTLPPDTMKLWQAMKNELTEAAQVNEIGMGQFAPKGRTSATEINKTTQSSSAMIRAMAQTVETRFLDPVLDLVWKTGLQHVSRNDKALQAAAGDEMFKALIGNRRELIARQITFQARGISALINKSAMLKSLLGVMQVVSSNELLAQEFVKVVDMNKFVLLLFELSDVDITKLQLSEREKKMRSITEPLQQLQQQGQEGGQGGGQASGPGAAEMTDLATSMGVLKDQHNSNQTHAIETVRDHQSHLMTHAHKQEQHTQKLTHTEAQHAQKMRHNEDMHIVSVAQAAQPKPQPTGVKGDKSRSH